MKIPNLINILLIAGILQLLFSTYLNGQNQMTKYFESQYGYGKYLFYDNDFKRAISELKKASYFHDFVGYKKADSINYLIGISYYKIKNYSRSNRYLALIPNIDSLLYGKAVFQLSKNYILNNDCDSAILYCKSVSEDKLLKMQSEKLTFILASSYLLLHKAESASEELQRANLTGSKLFNYCTELENFRPKSPFVAGSLSAIIPGTGKIYTNNLEHGLVTMFAVGLLGFRTVLEYNRGGINSAGFITFGVLLLITYTANIIGSAVSAKLYNEKHYNKIDSKVLDFVNEYD